MDHDLFSTASSWIWMDGAADVNCYLQFRTDFVAAGISAGKAVCAMIGVAFLPIFSAPIFSVSGRNSPVSGKRWRKNLACITPRVIC